MAGEVEPLALRSRLRDLKKGLGEPSWAMIAGQRQEMLFPPSSEKIGNISWS